VAQGDGGGHGNRVAGEQAELHARVALRDAIAKKLTLHLRFEWIALHKKRLGQFQIEIVIHLF
jgi:hypothetical protein